MTHPYYLYMLHESPVEPPYYCKLGITSNPLARLRHLQSGNPRALRAWDYERRPSRQFGFILPSKAYALRLEQRLLQSFQEQGVRLSQDYDYENNTASAREWIEGIKPEELWQLIATAYMKFVNEFHLLEQLDQLRINRARKST